MVQEKSPRGITQLWIPRLQKVHLVTLYQRDLTYTHRIATSTLVHVNQTWQHSTRQLDADIVQPHWLTLEEIRDLEGRLRSPVVLQVLDDYRRGVAYPLALINTF